MSLSISSVFDISLISGVSKTQGIIDISACESTGEMYEIIIKELQEKNIEDLNHSAILFRTNAALQSFANTLAGKRIPFVVREKIQSYYEHFIVCDILDFFNASNGCRDRALFLRLCDKLNLSFGRALFREEEVDLVVLNNRLRNSIYDSGMEIHQLDTLKQQFKRLSGMRPALGITYILHAMNYEKYLLKKAGNQSIIPDDWKEVLEWSYDFYKGNYDELMERFNVPEELQIDNMNEELVMSLMRITKLYMTNKGRIAWLCEYPTEEDGLAYEFNEEGLWMIPQWQII
mgnify:CR=1 FL=1